MHVIYLQFIAKSLWVRSNVSRLPIADSDPSGFTKSSFASKLQLPNNPRVVFYTIKTKTINPH